MSIAVGFVLEPLTPPPAVNTGVNPRDRYILIRHPWYNDSQNILFKFFAPDKTTRGLYAQVILDACGVIVGNRWDGWLSDHKDSREAIEDQRDPNDVLEKTNYYFHLPSSPASSSSTHDQIANVPYPIVPTFQHWRFPHGDLPRLWQQSKLTTNRDPANSTCTVTSMTPLVQNRDESCRITAYNSYVEVAHIVPKKEELWWRNNGMHAYSIGKTSKIDNPENGFLLRGDLHQAFDQSAFIIVPKLRSNKELPCLVVHLLVPNSQHEVMYHGHKLQGFDASIDLLFARFASAIFPMLDGFLAGTERRQLQNLDSTVPTDDGGFCSPDECVKFTSAGLLAAKKDANKDAKKRKPSNTDDDHFLIGEQKSPSPKKQYSSTTLDKSSSDAGSAISSSESDQSVISTNPNNPNAKLAQKWLAQERLRSDPANQWKKDEKWSKRVWKGDVALTPTEVRRWLEINGAEVRDES